MRRGSRASGSNRVRPFSRWTGTDRQKWDRFGALEPIQASSNLLERIVSETPVNSTANASFSCGLQET
eukprot:2986397-Prymnesium_polylepis.2